MDYVGLLKKSREDMPEIVKERVRFEVPKVKGHIQGNKTVIINFSQICDTLSREQKHILKFLLKELATSGEIKGSGALIFGTKLPSSRINEKLKEYAFEFVLCRECGKPDTKIIKEKGLSILKCNACGKKNVVKDFVV